VIYDPLLDFDNPELFEPWFRGPSWDAWRVIIKAAFGQRLTAPELEVFHQLAGDREPPRRRVEELWVIAGRRSGKDSVASFLAISAEYEAVLRPGERATVLLLAHTRDQARILRKYVEGYFHRVPMLGAMVERESQDGIELNNQTEITVAPNSYRSVRGRTCLCCIMDEVAFWRDEESRNPDIEVYNAISPALGTLPGAMLIGISTPYRRSGLLYGKWSEHYGKSDEDVLVIKAPSRLLNPNLSQTRIDRDLARDREASGAEWLAEFRSDLADYVDRRTVEELVIRERRELMPALGVQYEAFVDPSGGSSDSFTLAISHRSHDSLGILDALREISPPFAPSSVVQEFAELLKTCRITKVRGDRYAGEWPREQFLKHGITYESSERSKSEIYVQALPLLNSGRVELLDNNRLISQISNLERRTSRGTGRDLVDHPPGQKDDLANAALGGL